MLSRAPRGWFKAKSMTWPRATNSPKIITARLLAFRRPVARMGLCGPQHNARVAHAVPTRDRSDSARLPVGLLVPRPRPGGAEGFTETGLASWYGTSEQGRKTASGERFDRKSMTAAHRSLPFGTMVRVTSLENGRAVLVRINDRGPFVHGRIIDLSAAAATSLGIHENGVARVKLAVYRSDQRRHRFDLADLGSSDIEVDGAGH
jgi:rare lipoprotein A (peptidoglycan hydrolase)